MAKTWGVEGRNYFQFVSFSFAMGGIIAPLVASPFFEQPYIELLNLTNSTNRSAYSGVPVVLAVRNESVTNATRLEVAEAIGISHIQYPFAIAGGLFMCASVSLMFLLCAYPEKSAVSTSVSGSGSVEEFQPLPTNQTAFFLFLLFLLYMASSSVFFILQSYLMTFAVRQMKWKRSMGAVLTSVMWASLAFGRLVGIFLARCLSPACMIYISFFGMFLSTFGQFGGGYFKMDFLIWIFIPLMSTFMSIFSPCLTVWIKENLISISGRIASFTIVTTSVAMMTFPMYLGYLIDKVSPMWFVYVQPMDSLAAIVLFTILVVGVRYARRFTIGTESEKKPLLNGDGGIQ